MKVIYFDCSSGASGDMLLGALLDAYLQLNASSRQDDFQPVLQPWLEQIDSLLKVEAGGRVELSVVSRAGIEALKVDFFVGSEPADSYGSEAHAALHSHAHDHLHNHTHSHDHSHSHVHPPHDHPHLEEHHQDHHAHPHRAYREIRVLFNEHAEKETFPQKARALALEMFHLLATAESIVHGTSVDEVHFHEVGAFDSIMDIGGIAAALSLFDYEQVIVSPVTVGSGFTNSAHGILSIPPPAVLEIVKLKGIPMSDLSLPGECLTPTGACVLGTIASTYGPLNGTKRVLAQGFGAGSRDPQAKANVVRCIVAEI